ncbi:MAG: Hsp20/alpha crystallin family protein [Actinomycetota bacterium]|nr:MAG: heat shock protein Hsp20 [Acidimicrobiaceae bacterium]
MIKNKMLTPTVEQWPSWFGRLGFPESWQQFLDSETIKVEEFKEGDLIVVRAELPGIDPDKDVEVTVADGMLRIHAERTQEAMQEGKDKEHYRSEFRYGEFTRVLALPAGATEADVTATYRDGILEVRVPTSDEKAAARKVAIARG